MLLLLALLGAAATNGQEDSGFSNLQVLDPDITRGDLGRAWIHPSLIGTLRQTKRKRN
jgi:hypothetical protein